jgi:DHA3 family tetracycline resistance protein-like MFS transporter
LTTQAPITRWDATRVYLIINALRAVAHTLYVTVFILFQIQVLQLDALQLVLVGTALEVGAFFFEIPTGIIADVYSRRLSVILGSFTTGIAFLIVVAVPNFGGMLLGNVIWGIGFTFFSGALQAWLVDEIGIERASQSFLRGSQVSNVAHLVAIPLAIVVGSQWLALPILIAGVVALALGVLLIAVMPETGFQPLPREDRQLWRAFGRTLREGWGVVRGSQALTALMLVGVIWGASSEGFDRLSAKYLYDTFGIPPLPVPYPEVVWFGARDMVLAVIGIGAAELIRRRIEGAPQARTVWLLVGFTGGIVGGLYLYTFTPSFWWAMLVFMLIRTLRDIAIPVFDVWANRNIPSNVRATVLSMYGQSDAVGQLAGGPAVGVAGNASIRLAILISATILTPALPLLIQASQHPEPESNAV